ncbi:MAG: branched-chain amino acid transport system permease protein, partial [Acidimicrobiaceae bacterium]|nr:branched-chain amino acid transport system permease protein [Acidimicrobiaceae bacterium]
MTATRAAAAQLDGLRARPGTGARGRGIALAGMVAVVVGSFSPWATFAFGYPGKMTLSGFAGGARTFTLVLGLVGLLALVDIPGRRRAGLAGAAGCLLVALGNFIAITNQGGGLGAPAWGAWVTTVGAVLLLAGFVLMPDDRPVSDTWPRLPAAAELLLVSA